MYTYIGLGVGIVFIILFIYKILPALKLKGDVSKWIKGVLFIGMMTYLSVDFIMKEKYTYLIVIVLGSIGFLWMLKESKPKSSD
ncbi:MAG: hypothetical protein MUC81_10065 [Bacteroidia bacterium]|jgi:hypothetical protein|nr:hypothetical protein [Bacteroidia bacterium]